MAITFALVLLCGAVVAETNVTNPWVPIDYRTLPVAKPNDRFELYYLVAPLLKASYGNILGYVHLYHGAMGMKNLDNGASFTFNYDADDFFRSNLFPEVKQYPNGTRYLQWDNDGAVFIYNGVWDEYWSEGITKVATFNGTVYNDLMKNWIATTNATHRFYNMLSIKKPSGENFVDGWDCFDFCWATFAQVAKRGAVMSSTPLKRNSVNVYASEVRPVPYSGSARDEINAFYQFIEVALNKMHLDQIVSEIFRIFSGKWFVRVDESYLSIQLQWPLFSISSDKKTPLGTQVAVEHLVRAKAPAIQA